MCLFFRYQKLSVTIGKLFFSTHHDDHKVTTSCGFFLQGPDSIPDDLIWQKKEGAAPSGGGILKNCLYREVQPGGQTPYPLFKYHFS